LIQEIAEARSRPGVECIVLDAALLLEAGWRRLCDRVIFVDAPDEQRFQRVATSRGWSADQLRAREESQFTLERKRMEADDVVDNSHSAEHACSQLEAVLSRIGSHKSS
ncbi:MAG TPA: dephospho-CoA kinase, partial [Planctomycetaceae bacterium]|nr:dephospho-CoA kinase [Planctomycetaceae bacterium]